MAVFHIVLENTDKIDSLLNVNWIEFLTHPYIAYELAEGLFAFPPSLSKAKLRATPSNGKVWLAGSGWLAALPPLKSALKIGAIM